MHVVVLLLIVLLAIVDGVLAKVDCCMVGLEVVLRR